MLSPKNIVQYCSGPEIRVSRAYVAAELPNGLLLKKVGPKLLLSTLVVTWGIVTTFQGQWLGGIISTISFKGLTGAYPGFVTYAGLITIRVLLGLLEGPVFPSVVLYLSSFYTRKDLSLRYGSHD